MVATYSSLGEDLLNLCIMAGPKDCAAIRHAYLRNNVLYLEASLSRYVEHDEDSDWESRLCRDRYRAWTEVNADWRRLVTEERIDSLARTSEEDTENEADCMYAFVDPLIPLVNPAVAIELGLIETLKHLVEKRGIDVNAYRWTNYTHGRVGPVHLLMHCIGCDAFESFEYLLSTSDIDINCQYKDEAEEAATILEHCFGFECRFFRGLLRHPTCNFSTNFKFREQSVPLLFALFFLTAFFEKIWFDVRVWKTNFLELLAAGVDPFVEEERSGDAIHYARKLSFSVQWGSPLHKALEEAVGILEDWVATK
mmetsp:Transcript_21787/g.62480  ORF Transcript_21787/g.62480 Transcript_21787/m.62480 type:complete len:310 (+) Transcript_21787:185-1114(+)